MSNDNKYLPSPPSENQKWAYLKNPRRGILFVAYIFTMIAVSSQIKFALSTPQNRIFLLPALFVVSVATLSLYTSTRKRQITIQSHKNKTQTWAEGRHKNQHPSVDVFLPSCGEPLPVLENTYKHVAAMKWKGTLRAYVLDDSANPEVAALAEQYHLTYLTRPNRGHMKKAGNLKYGYEHSTGDHIVVLDADFAPRVDFLNELIPYMDQENVGIVQSPQFFESTAKMNWLQRGAGITQEFFYRWVQPSRDSAGAPICVGTCAVYRRAALNAAGGFAQIGHSEDVHTGVKLLKAGYITRYVPVNVSKGLCPDSLEGFITQQYRWCTGSMSLLIDPSFHRRKLGWRRKMCFFSGFGYYLVTSMLAFVTPLPALAMMWLYTTSFHPSNYVWILPALLWVWVVVPKVLHGKWGPEMLRVQTIYGYAHAVAVYDTFRGKTAGWVPTGVVSGGGEGKQTETPLPTRVKRLMFTWIAVTQTGLWGGLIYATWTNGTWLTSLPIVMILTLSSVVQLPILKQLKDPRNSSEIRLARRRVTTSLVTVAAAGVVTTVAIGNAALLPVTAVVAVAPRPAPVTEVSPVTVGGEITIPKGTGLTVAAAAQTTTTNKRKGNHGSKKHPVKVAPITVACETASTVSGHDFVNSKYEGERYRLGYGQRVDFCTTPNGYTRVLNIITRKYVEDAPSARIVLDKTKDYVTKCGDKCVKVTTVIDGRVINGDDKVKAIGTVYVTTKIVNRTAVTTSSIEYQTK